MTSSADHPAWMTEDEGAGVDAVANEIVGQFKGDLTITEMLQVGDLLVLQVLKNRALHSASEARSQKTPDEDDPLGVLWSATSEERAWVDAYRKLQERSSAILHELKATRSQRIKTIHGT
jgi:hypothetical protein